MDQLKWNISLWYMMLVSSDKSNNFSYIFFLPYEGFLFFIRPHLLPELFTRGNMSHLLYNSSIVTTLNEASIKMPQRYVSSFEKSMDEGVPPSPKNLLTLQTKQSKKNNVCWLNENYRCFFNSEILPAFNGYCIGLQLLLHRALGALLSKLIYFN